MRDPDGILRDDRWPDVVVVSDTSPDIVVLSLLGAIDLKDADVLLGTDILGGAGLREGDETGFVVVGP